MKPLAVALGDPAGIGPEIVAAAWASRRSNDLPPFFAALQQAEGLTADGERKE